MIKIHSTKGIGVDAVKCLVYGASGSGKTVLSATAPAPIIISAESGLLSLADSDIPFLEIKSMADINEAYNYCLKSEYKTIVLDSISELTETLLIETKEQMAKESSSGKIDARQAYGRMAEETLAMIRNFRDIKDKNVVFNCKMAKREDAETGVFFYEPMMPGRVLPNNISYLFDEVFCLLIDRKGERYLQTNSDRKRDCKDRSGKLEKSEPVILGVKTMTQLFNKIKLEKKS